MTILQNRISQLSTIIHAWNELEEGSQKKSINFISEFIESASLLQKMLTRCLFSKPDAMKEYLLPLNSGIFQSDLTREQLLYILNAYKASVGIKGPVLSAKAKVTLTPEQEQEAKDTVCFP
jgi:hypothetical protein